MDLKLKDENYYELKHSEVAKHFEGNPEYMFTIPIEGKARAVYYVKEPNKEKGYKHYMILYSVPSGTSFDPIKLMVSGMDEEMLQKYCTIPVIQCRHCQDVIYSCDRHHMSTCSCKKVSIDGGDVYVKISGEPQDYDFYKFNIRTKEVVLST
jgi:hypothetical protein